MKPVIFRVKTMVAVCFIAAMLTACGGAPSEADMKSAITKQIQAELNVAKSFMGGAGASMAENLTPKLKDLKKIGCKEDGEKAYRCDIEVEMIFRGQTNKSPGSVRFVKGSDGWMASK